MGREDGLVQVQPLRILLERFRLSKSQRRVLRRNTDLTLKTGPACIDDTRRQLFDAHKQRFQDNLPPSLDGYLGVRPGACPCETIELALYKQDYFLAASYLDLGRQAASSVYAMFDLAKSRRSLGTLTMLLEIAYARQRACRYYYPGYAYDAPSAYDYKKRLSAMEYFDWKGHWLALPRQE